MYTIHLHRLELSIEVDDVYAMRTIVSWYARLFAHEATVYFGWSHPLKGA